MDKLKIWNEEQENNDSPELARIRMDLDWIEEVWGPTIAKRVALVMHWPEFQGQNISSVANEVSAYEAAEMARELVRPFKNMRFRDSSVA